MNAFDGKNTFYKQKFSSLQISDTVIRNKEFEECVFEKSSFITCMFEHCRFLECTFTVSTLSAVGLLNSDVIDVVFKDSKALGLDWVKAKHIRNTNFEKSDISYSNFRMLKLPKIIIRDCTAKEVDFTESDLSDGDFRRTDFEKTRFLNSNLSRTDFRNAYNYSIDVKANIIKKAKFSLPEAASLLTGLDIMLEY